MGVILLTDALAALTGSITIGGDDLSVAGSLGVVAGAAVGGDCNVTGKVNCDNLETVSTVDCGGNLEVAGTVQFTALPDADPDVAGHLFETAGDVQISDGP
jgi:hypothetical protein